MESQDKDLNTELGNNPEAESPPDVVPVEPQAEETAAEGLETPSYAALPPAKKSRRSWIIGIVAAVVLLCVACVIVAILGRQYLAFLGPKQVAPKIMPADTAFFASINVDIEDAVGYKHLAKVYGDIRQVEKAIDDVIEDMEDELDISYKDDIKPWLGSELAIAITNMEDVLEEEEPVVIIAAATKDTKASDAFLDKVREYLEDQDYNVDKETYKDVTYYVQEVESDWETPLIFGTVKKFVILTTDEDTMEKVIDVTKGDADSLADNERYTDLIDALPGDAVAYVFLDMEDAIQAGLESVEDEGVGLPRKTSNQIEAFQALGLALSLDKEGIQLDAAVAFDPDALPSEILEGFEAKASTNRILEQIPDDAVGFLSGQNLATAWKSVFDGLMGIPDAEEQLDALTDELGLEVDEGLFDWLSGEFAIVVVKAKGLEDVPIGGFAVFEVDDLDKAEDTLEDIVDALEKVGDIELEEEKVDDVEMQVIVDPYSEEIILGYGFTDKHLIIGVTEDALEDAVDDDFQSIAGDETFKKVQKHLPGKTGGYFYANVDEILRLVYKSMSDYDQETYEKEFSPFLEPIKAIGIASPLTDPKKGISQSTIFIYIPGD